MDRRRLKAELADAVDAVRRGANRALLPEQRAFMGDRDDRERGARIRRPRHDGATFLVMPEHVKNAKRTANAVLELAVTLGCAGTSSGTAGAAQYQKLKRK